MTNTGINEILKRLLKNVGETGLEPAALRSQTVRSSHLSYSPSENKSLKSAAGGNRTHTLLLVRDFKSRESTNSATAATINSQIIPFFVG